MRWRSALVSGRAFARLAIGTCCAFALLGFRDPGCGGGGSERAGLNGPCTRTKDCEPTLRCFEGVCVPEDAGILDGSTDGAIDVTTDAGGDP